MPDARWAVRAVVLAGLVGLTACSSGLRAGGGEDQPQNPSSIVVDFKAGVPLHRARAEVRRCHPIAITGSDTARVHGHRASSIFISERNRRSIGVVQRHRPRQYPAMLPVSTLLKRSRVMAADEPV
jgi:hypothetical protein